MGNFKEKLQNNILTPAVQNRRNFTITAQVTHSDERNNLCSIRYIDKDGYISNKNNVPVKLYNSSFIDWFPKENDIVVIEESDNDVKIVSIYDNNYSANIRSNLENKKDILSANFFDTMPGRLF